MGLVIACLIGLSTGCTTTLYVTGETCLDCYGSKSCTGCDGNPPVDGKLVLYDLCGVCGGDGSTCQGCNNVYGSGLNFDDCGVCGGNGSTCEDAITPAAVIFSPADSGTTGLVYRLPLTVNFSCTTANAQYYYTFYPVVSGSENTNLPPNLFSATGNQVKLSENATLEVFAYVSGLKVGTVSTGIFLVSTDGVIPGQTGTTAPETSGLLLPIWAVAVIVVAGVVLVVFFAVIITFIRIKNRNDLVHIRLEANEQIAREDHHRAVQDYEAIRDDEITLRIGDVIRVTSKHEDGWWEGDSYRLKGKHGFFPGSYVQLIPAERLMWVERPKTVFGRASRRVTQFLGSSNYGTDPQAVEPSKMAKRVSKAFGFQNSNSSQTQMLKPEKPNMPLPPRPTSQLPPIPKTNGANYNNSHNRQQNNFNNSTY